jgi:hypothetical protein
VAQCHLQGLACHCWLLAPSSTRHATACFVGIVVPHPSQLPTCGPLRLVIFESPVGLVASPTCGTMPRSSCGAIPHSTCGTMPPSSWHNATSDSWCSPQFNLGHCRLVAHCHTQLVAQCHLRSCLAHAGTPVACCSQGASTPVAATPAGSTPIQLGDIANLWRIVTLNLWRNAIFDQKVSGDLT